ncbi:MAG: 2-phospho-L-lactate guanylyltransferase [Sphaerobacter sp.]|nr:2-phospho-L-lactate guanylyltransferase [Sphaerobacter sp.]
MTTIAVVPVQRLGTAKSRLAGHLSPDERRALVLTLLDRAVGALQAATAVDQVIVVSPDEVVLQRAAARGATALRQPDEGLNAAVRLGRAAALRRGADTLLVLLGDLPRITAADIDALLAELPDRGVVLAPDRHGRGTNAAALRPPDAIEPAFGDDSLARHRARAAARGLVVREFHAPGIGLDVDTPADLAAMGRLGSLDPRQVDPGD